MRVRRVLETRAGRRPTAAATSAALIAGLLVGLGSSAAPFVPAAAAAPTAARSVSGLPTEQAAMRAAQSQGSRVEVLSEHTSQQQVWANPDGTVSVDSYAGPQWVQRADGSWDTIDTNLSVVG